MGGSGTYCRFDANRGKIRYVNHPLHRCTNTGKAKIFLRHYKVTLLLITQEDIQSMEQEISSAKVKSDGAIQNFDEFLKDEFLMTLMKLRLGSLC